nr:hypothetical protein [Chroococcidiopsis cubana]
MKQLLRLFLPLAGIALFQTTAIAQEADGCFMLDSAGQTIDLSTVCGLPKKNSAHASEFQAKIKRRESGIPVIDVTFNGQQKFEMLLGYWGFSNHNHDGDGTSVRSRSNWYAQSTNCQWRYSRIPHWTGSFNECRQGYSSRTKSFDY